MLPSLFKLPSILMMQSEILLLEWNSFKRAVGVWDDLAPNLETEKKAGKFQSYHKSYSETL
jgi:hypothetical protein